MPADPTLADLPALVVALAAEVRLLRAAVGRPPARLIRAADAAAYLSMAESTFCELVTLGRLPQRVYTDAGPRWDVRQLDRYADACRTRRRRPALKLADTTGGV